MMAKAVLISIKPKWCQLIASGKKMVEVRKTRPKLETPFKCYIYCTYGDGLIERSDPVLPNMLIEQKVTNGRAWGNCCNGKVIGEFVCDRIDRVARIGYSGSGSSPLYHIRVSDFRVVPAVETFRDACLSESEAEAYLNGRIGYGWHISDLVIYDRPMELSDFTGLRKTKFGMEPVSLVRPPQSWCYVEKLKEDDSK